MNPIHWALRVAGAFFGVLAVLQFARFVAGAEVVVAGHVIPLWASAIACAVATALSSWMWWAASANSRRRMK